MLTLKEQAKREKMETILKRIKYRLYQAEIQFASHDNERLVDTMKKIRVNSRKITRLLTGQEIKGTKALKPVKKGKNSITK